MTRIYRKNKVETVVEAQPHEHAIGKPVGWLRRLLAVFRTMTAILREVVPPENINNSQLENQIISKEGTTTFIWHDGNERYDEVAWDPRPATRDVAYEIALRLMESDRRATRVHIDFGETTFVEVSRPCSLAAGSLRVISERKAA
jgi:hypothetical protein